MLPVPGAATSRRELDASVDSLGKSKLIRGPLNVR